MVGTEGVSLIPVTSLSSRFSFSSPLCVLNTSPLLSIHSNEHKDRVIAVYYMVSHRCRQKPSSDPGSALHVLNS